MGYELNKLLEHYGLSSPTIASYGGSTDAERGAYEAYVNSYKDRVKNTSMYGYGATDKIAPPTYSKPVSSTTAATPAATTPIALPAVAPATSTPTSTQPLFITQGPTPLFAGPEPLFSGIWGTSSPYLSFGGWGMGRAKGGYVNFADGGAVDNAMAVDPITLKYYNSSPDLSAPIQPISSVSAPISFNNEVYSSPKVPSTSTPQTDELAYFYNDAYNYPEVPVAPVVDNTTTAPTPKDDRNKLLADMLAKYGPQEGGYKSELEDARARYKEETDAFNKMLVNSMSSPEQDNLSKAELYFRLAAAFGSPTKTKQGFLENLGAAGQQLSEYSKGQRESELAKSQLKIKGQEMRQQAAKQELTDLRTLAAEEMKDKRAMATKLIEEYVKSGEAKSTAGKQAQDEGLRPGTPEFQKRTAEIANYNVENMLAKFGLQQQQMQIALANLGINQSKAQQLSSKEMEMKLNSEKTIESYGQVLSDLSRAFELNPNSLAGGWLEKGQAWLAGVAGSNDPIYVNTRELNNLLGSQALEKLRATFGGNPTEGERGILLELQGIGSKSREERARIIKRAYAAVKRRNDLEKDRLNRINRGEYRTSDSGNPAN